MKNEYENTLQAIEQCEEVGHENRLLVDVKYANDPC